MYASDVTRSYLVSGRFSGGPAQAIYEIVLAAQKAGFACGEAGRGLPRGPRRHGASSSWTACSPLGILTGVPRRDLEDARVPEVLPARIEPLGRAERPRRREATRFLRWASIGSRVTASRRRSSRPAWCSRSSPASISQRAALRPTPRGRGPRCALERSRRPGSRTSFS